MKRPVHILRMRVQTCSISLHNDQPGARRTVPWLGRDHVVFRGTLTIRSFGSDGTAEIHLHSGTMLVYPVAAGKPGGFIEIDSSGASEDRGFFGVTTALFDRILSVSLAHMSGHQASMEVQFPLLRYSKGGSKAPLGPISLSYGERFHFSEE